MLFGRLLTKYEEQDLKSLFWLILLIVLPLSSKVQSQSLQSSVPSPATFEAPLFESGFGAPTFSVTLHLNSLGSDQSQRGRLSQRAWLEIGAVTLTGVGHLAFSAFDASNVFIPLAMAGWGSYVYYRARTEPGFLNRIGLTSEQLGPAFRDVSLVAASSLALMAGYGAWKGSLRLHRDMLPLMLLYPSWGLVQQFLVQGLVAGNLTQSAAPLGSPYVVTPVSATLFGAVHLPSWDLAAGTSAIGLAFTPIYLKRRNLWPLGLYHGWLGVAYYFWVLDRNPWHYVVQ